jgi:hypothetical protein
MAPAANGFLFATSGLTLSTNSKKRLLVSSGGTSTFSGDTTGVTINEVVGAYGQLFSVVDDLSNVIYSANDVSGNPILKVNANNSILGGTPYAYNFMVSGSSIVGGGQVTTSSGTFGDGITSMMNTMSSWSTNYFQGQVLYNETLAATISTGQLCYRSQAGKWDLADATSEQALSFNMLGICLKGGSANATSLILINGFVQISSGFLTSNKSGQPIYMDITPGSMSNIAPSAPGNVVRVIGHMMHNSNSNSLKILYFNPDASWVTL